jgi:hypothetical protein
LVGRKGITFNDRGRGLRLAHQALRYALSHQGMLAMAGAPIRALQDFLPGGVRAATGWIDADEGERAQPRHAPEQLTRADAAHWDCGDNNANGLQRDQPVPEPTL